MPFPATGGNPEGAATCPDGDRPLGNHRRRPLPVASEAGDGSFSTPAQSDELRPSAPRLRGWPAGRSRTLTIAEDQGPTNTDHFYQRDGGDRPERAEGLGTNPPSATIGPKSPLRKPRTCRRAPPPSIPAPDGHGGRHVGTSRTPEPPPLYRRHPGGESNFFKFKHTKMEKALRGRPGVNTGLESSRVWLSQRGSKAENLNPFLKERKKRKKNSVKISETYL